MKDKSVKELQREVSVLTIEAEEREKKDKELTQKIVLCLEVLTQWVRDRK